MVEWKDGTKVSDAYVDSNNNIVPAVYSGNTPLSAYNLNKMQQLIDVYRGNNITAKTAQGAGKIRKIFGNLSQKTSTQGKNICPTGFENWESGQYNTQGVKTDNEYRIRLKKLIRVTPNTSYYITTSDNTTKYYFIIRLYNSAGTFLNSLGGMNNKTTFTTTADVYYISLSIYGSDNSTESYSNYQTLFENETITPFICLNSETDKTYEEFTPNMPSPDYPAEISVVENEISYKTRNKNSFNIDAFQSQIQNLHTNYANVAKKDNGFSITSTDSDCYFSKGNTNNDVLMEIVPGVKNYLSYDSTGSNTIAKYVNYYDKNYSIISSNNWIGASNKVNFTPPSNAKYVFIRFGLAYQVGITATITNIMLCTEDIEYIAHQSETTTLKLPQNEFLAKINDYQDYIDEDGTIHKKIRKIVFDGTESWNRSKFSSDNYSKFYFDDNYLASIDIKIFCCSHFLYGGTSSLNKNCIDMYETNSGNLGINCCIENSIASTVSAFKSWLSEQYTAGTPVTVYYVLAEEYTTTCDFANIVSQYADETNLICDTEVETEFTQSDGIASVLKTLKILQNNTSGGV